jgi:sulfate permease, SulP family
MGYGMFAFTALGDNYFAHGALAGLYAAITAGVVCVVLGDRTTTVYAPRVTTTFLLGALLYQLVHSEAEVCAAAMCTSLFSPSSRLFFSAA